MPNNAHVTYRVLTIPAEFEPVNFDLIYDAGYEMEGSTPHAFPIPGYVFMFWNLGESPNMFTNVTIPHGISSVTAWYLPNTGGFGISTFAFSETQNKLLAVTPIQSVQPPEAYSGGNNVTPSLTGSITINAYTLLGGEVLDTWVAFSGAPTISGPSLTLQKGQGTYAIAFYRRPMLLSPINYSTDYTVDISSTHVTVSGHVAQLGGPSAAPSSLYRPVASMPSIVAPLDSGAIQPEMAPVGPNSKPLEVRSATPPIEK